MNEHQWKVVLLSEGQLRDVRPEDILDEGLYRRCDTYRGGGGYDEFPSIASGRWGADPGQFRHQFVVQLQGCNLDCPYCYVTREGVWGSYQQVSTEEIVWAFFRSGQQVFHLMGGAPALQMKFWPELLDELGPNVIFHSDFLLTESDYQEKVLKQIGRPNTLYAIDVKGTTSEEWRRNTRKDFNPDLFWRNWLALQECEVPAYVTFTNCTEIGIKQFWQEACHQGISPQWEENSFTIDVIEYKAMAYTDRVPWGSCRR